MPQQFDPAALQQYYSIAMGQPIAQPMVNPEQINQYNQPVIPVAVPVPEFENYAPQQFQPQVQMPQQAQQQNPQLQIQKQRMDYAAMIEQRFNEIADHVGGINALVQTNNLDAARKKATDDIRMMFGDPPEIQQEPRIVEMDGNKIAVGGPIKTGIVLPNQTEREAAQVGLEKSKFELEQAKKKMESEFGKLSQDQASQLTGLDQSVRIFQNALDLAAKMKSDPILAETVGGGSLLGGLKRGYDRIVPGTPQFDFATNAQRLNSAAFAEAIKMLQGTGAVSNIEGQAITKALTDVGNLGMSPEQYSSRLDEFMKLMQGTIASKQNQISSFGKKQEGKPKIDLNSFDFSSLPADPNSQGQPVSPNEPMRITSPGATQFIRVNGKLTRQQ